MNKMIYFHIDEVARDSVVASNLKKICAGFGIKVIYGNRLTTEFLKDCNPFDVVIVPDADYVERMCPTPELLEKLKSKIICLPTEGVGTIAAGRPLRDLIMHYLGYAYERGERQYAEAVSYFAQWGEASRFVFENEAKHILHKCVTVGHPRLDIRCQKSAFAENTRKDKIKLGYISRFSVVNSFIERSIIETVYDSRFKSNTTHLYSEGTDIEDRYVTEIIDLRILFGICDKLDFSKYELIIRIHPRENWTNWKKLLHRFKIPATICQWDMPFAHWVSSVDYVFGPSSTSFYDTFSIGIKPICTNDIIKTRNNHLIEGSDDFNPISNYAHRPQSFEDFFEIIKDRGQNEVVPDQVLKLLKDEANYPESEKSLDALVKLCVELLKESKQKGLGRVLSYVKYSLRVEWLAFKAVVRNREGISSYFLMTRKRKIWIDKLAG